MQYNYNFYEEANALCLIKHELEINLLGPILLTSQFLPNLVGKLESLNIKVFEIMPSLVDTPMTEGRGNGKISPKQLVDEFWSNFIRNRYEIHIGKVKLLYFLNRAVPKLAERIMR